MTLPKFSLERMDFLLVDDNPHMRSLVKGILVALGAHHIHEASDGDDALKLLHETPVDIVICDWLMTPLDGIEFVRLLRNSPDSPNPYLPVILLTGYTDLTRVREARDAGVHEFLAKPVSVQGLLSHIGNIVSKPQPFIRCTSFVGPDRRRRATDYTGPERRLIKPRPVAMTDPT